ncbi:Friend virus susceptibility protein 1-like [Rhinatrema bivittatum]|uniref:Friend virus susceptibility protein 1-like n=1 Tax=Rhinatrema bivittatum TaxID=194408 RepID=UPI00112A82AE|nr:Friend virus susceptibility protein 1-like [Rhinatrema bivittatum]
MKTEWDPETWDGDIWDSTDSEREAEIDPLSETMIGQVCPVIRRKLKQASDGVVVASEATQVLEDFSQHEISKILDRMGQRPGEPLDKWLVHLYESGAGDITIDQRDVKHFTMISTDPEIRAAVRTVTGHGDMTNLFMVVAYAAKSRYPSIIDWPITSRTLYSMRDIIQRIKELTMQVWCIRGVQGKFTALTLPHTARTDIMKNLTPQHKSIMLTLMINNAGKTIGDLIKAIREVLELGACDMDGREKRYLYEKDHIGARVPERMESAPKGFRDLRNRETKAMVSIRDMFAALIAAGVAKDKIDGIPTKEMYKLYLQK